MPVILHFALNLCPAEVKHNMLLSADEQGFPPLFPRSIYLKGDGLPSKLS